MIPWTTITHLADTVVTIPAAFAILLWLIAGRAWRMAFWWSTLFSSGLLVVAATKIAFMGWGIGIPSWDFAGMSGHAMRATAIAPVILFLILQKSSRPLRISGIAAGILFGLLIGVSRMAVHAHSASEAIAGCLLGAAISLGFIGISRFLPKPKVNRWLITASFIALIPTSYAKPAPTNSWLYGLALYLSGNDKPFARSDWTAAPLDDTDPNKVKSGNIRHTKAAI